MLHAVIAIVATILFLFLFATVGAMLTRGLDYWLRRLAAEGRAPVDVLIDLFKRLLFRRARKSRPRCPRR